VRYSGRAAKHDFRRREVIPEGPGAEVFEVSARAVAISEVVTG